MIVEQIEEFCKDQRLPFQLQIRASDIPEAGLGLFLRNRERTIPAGTVVALYPGLVYDGISDPILLPSINNRYVIQRRSGSLIDGKDAGLSRLLYQSVWNRERAVTGISYDKLWLDQRRLLMMMAWTDSYWNFGQLINNAVDDDGNCVVYQEFLLPDDWGLGVRNWRRFIPNIPYSGGLAIQGIALVTCKELEKGGERELLSLYHDVSVQ